ncbi:hypothetical protein GF326_10965 [Candidatus Bathyarchaeota archaeon]|nr:hypothetical protein [Candidatus Bathyarchaeota archaeon]
MGRSLEKIVREASEKWIDIPGVTGVGISKENVRDIILVMVKEDTIEIRQKIPHKYKGIKVQIQETGVISAEDEKIK